MKPLFLVLLLWCGALVHAAVPTAAIATLFGSPANLELVRTADKVDVCILHRVAPAPRADGSVDWSTEHYEETPFVPVATDVAATLRRLLVDDKTYDWKSTDGRRPQFYLRLRFAHGDSAVVVDFCFMCHVLNVTSRGQDVAHANFKPNSDLFLQAFLKVFPHDKPLQQVAHEAGL